MNHMENLVAHVILSHRNGREEDEYQIFDNGHILLDHDNGFHQDRTKELTVSDLDETTQRKILEQLPSEKREIVKQLFDI